MDSGKDASSSTTQTQSSTIFLNRNSPVRFQAMGSVDQLHVTTPGVVKNNDQVMEGDDAHQRTHSRQDRAECAGREQRSDTELDHAERIGFAAQAKDLQA
jgi:hypothetical protein